MDVRTKGEEIRMSQSISLFRSHRRLRAIAVIPAVAIALIVPAKPAHASCVANATGTANSDNVAAVASPDACPAAYGKPAGSGVGRKVG
jgi:hypothetical protein